MKMGDGTYSIHYRSMKVETPNTQGSFERANPILLQGEDSCGSFWINKSAVGRPYAARDVPQNGYFSAQIDDLPRQFMGWKATSEKPQTRVEVARQEVTPSSGIMISYKSRKLNVGEGGTPVGLYVHDVGVFGWPGNKVGEGFHRVANLEQDLRNYFRENIVQKYFERQRAKGRETDDIDYLGVNLLDIDGEAHGLLLTKDGKVILTSTRNVNDAVVEAARELGIEPRLRKIYGLNEEFGHLFRDSLGRIRKGTPPILEERETKEEQREIYLELAANSSGKERSEYLALAKIAEDDISTIERYKKIAHIQRKGLESMLKEEEETEESNSDNPKAEASYANIITSKDGRKKATKYDAENSKTYDNVVSMREHKGRNAKGKKGNAGDKSDDGRETVAREERTEREARGEEPANEPADAPSETAEAA